MRFLVDDGISLVKLLVCSQPKLAINTILGNIATVWHRILGANQRLIILIVNNTSPNGQPLLHDVWLAQITRRIRQGTSQRPKCDWELFRASQT